MRKKKRKSIKKTRKLYNIHLFFIILFIILFLIIFSIKTNKNHLEEKKIIRKPKVAGQFYPSSKLELNSQLEEYLQNSKVENIDDEIKALIVPHAGYIYSGQVAALGYKLLHKSYKTIFIIGSNHNPNSPYFKFSVPNVTHYKTPLGEVKVSSIAQELLKKDLFSNIPQAHATHIIEVQLPFFQRIMSNYEIVPIVTGSANLNELKQVADIISKYLDKETLIIISSDLSHYRPYNEAVKRDQSCIKNIANLDFEASSSCEACGLTAILILLDIAKQKNWKAKIIDYKNSGDTAGTKERVVGYSSIVFYKEDLTSKEKYFLSELSRNTLNTYYNTGEKMTVNQNLVSSRLKIVQGCFVTLNKNHNLRGCIGHILPQEELYKCVIDNSINAAINDKRFNPVSYSELEDIKIEISVLSVPEKLDYTTPEELLNQLRPNVDGVLIKSGRRQSTYLPQVWEQLPDKEFFLSKLCLKQGSPEDCWKEPNTEVYTYQATVWAE